MTIQITELEQRCIDAAGRIHDARISEPTTVGYRLDLVRAILAEAGVTDLVKAAERSRQGWENVVELGIILPQHTNSATILANELRAAVARVNGAE